MRKIVSVLLLALLSGQTASLLAATKQQEAGKTIQQSQATAAPLNNTDVLEMLKAGLSPEIIYAKIKTSPGSFDTSPAALRELKAAGVPDAVILAMLKPAHETHANSRPAGVAQPRETILVKLRDGTPVEIEPIFSISSADVQKESLISFRVATPVKVNGVTIIDGGALATAVVVKAKRGGSWGRAGQLAWVMRDVVGVDGKRIPLQSASSIKGISHAGEVATKTAVMGALLIPVFPIAPLILMHGFKRGENAVLPAGQRFEVFVQGDATVSATAPR